ncbi:MAG: hypothetical protein HQL15_01010 [Candidatus Omnitrophica bacterium]|nr:hypothetical protein [Candidatus Omnitrophota bacterium]
MKDSLSNKQKLDDLNKTSEECLFVVLSFMDPFFLRKKFVNSSSAINWIYFGDNFQERKSISLSLGNGFQLLDIAMTYRSIANEIKEDHVKWVDQISEQFVDDKEWWFGAVSSRNLKQSKLFVYSCFLELIDRLWKQKDNKPAIIVVESLSLAESIYLWGRKNKIQVKIIGSHSAKLRKCIRRISVFLSIFKFWIVQLIKCFAALITLNLRKKDKTEFQADTIITTHIHQNSVNKEDPFQDRYFPSLNNFLIKNGRKIAIYPLFYDIGWRYMNLYYRLRRNSSFFIIPEDYLSFSDYWSAITYPFRVLSKKINLKLFRNFDLSKIVREDQVERDFFLGQESVLLYRTCVKLKNSFPSLKRAILWYENRVTDKAIVMGLRKAFYNIKIIGAQIFLHHPYFLSLYTTSTEVSAGVSPDYLLCISYRECELAKLFAKNISCHPVAALRYKNVYDSVDIKSDSNNSVLVLLSYDFDESLEILEIVLEALRDLDKKYEFILKYHPDTDINNLKTVFGYERWSEKFVDAQEGLQNCFAKANMVISACSSSMVEAAIAGLPVIFIGSQTSLDENLLPFKELEMTTNRFNSKDLLKAIYRYSELTIDERLAYKKQGKELRDLYFLPTSEETMKPFLL